MSKNKGPGEGDGKEPAEKKARIESSGSDSERPEESQEEDAGAHANPEFEALFAASQAAQHTLYNTIATQRNNLALVNAIFASHQNPDVSNVVVPLPLVARMMIFTLLQAIVPAHQAILDAMVAQHADLAALQNIADQEDQVSDDESGDEGESEFDSDSQSESESEESESEESEKDETEHLVETSSNSHAAESFDATPNPYLPGSAGSVDSLELWH